jgi:hypothetical protein
MRVNRTQGVLEEENVLPLMTLKSPLLYSHYSTKGKFLNRFQTSDGKDAREDGGIDVL